MLKTTSELIEYLEKKNGKINWEIVRSYVNSIVKVGRKEDAQAILHLFNPQLCDYPSDLIPIFEKFGDLNFAKQIFDAFIVDDKLKDESEPEVLELLGNLRYEPVKPVLLNYAFRGTEDYYLAKCAILGLLNFDSHDIQEIISVEIEKIFGKGLFQEFIPALVCKLEDKKNLLDRLYKHGSTICSPDCNAGIILGFSLCGKEGLEYFKKALFNPFWEAYSSSTGTVHYAYRGMQNLKITFRYLYEDIIQFKDKEQIEYTLRVLLALLKVKITNTQFIITDSESFTDIYLLLYGREDKNNISDLAYQIDIGKGPSGIGEYLYKMGEYSYNIERLLKLKIDEEMILKNFQ